MSIEYCPTCRCDTLPLANGRCGWCSTILVDRSCECGGVAAPGQFRCYACITRDRAAGIRRRRGRPRRVA